MVGKSLPENVEELFAQKSVFIALCIGELPKTLPGWPWRDPSPVDSTPQMSASGCINTQLLRKGSPAWPGVERVFQLNNLG